MSIFFHAVHYHFCAKVNLYLLIWTKISPFQMKIQREPSTHDFIWDPVAPFWPCPTLILLWWSAMLFSHGEWDYTDSRECLVLTQHAAWLVLQIPCCSWDQTAKSANFSNQLLWEYELARGKSCICVRDL